MTEPTNAQLVEKSLSGSSAAWEALLGRYERLIYHTAIRAGADADEAADIFQAVCLIWLRELGRLRDPDRLGAWLVTITRRECWARWRSNRKDEAGTEEEEAPSDESPEALAAQAEDALLVRDALRKLAPPCRRLIWLLYYDPGRPSYEQIARKLGVPANSIGPMRARCLRKLGEILQQRGW